MVRIVSKSANQMPAQDPIAPRAMGLHLVVLDRGFVYVGSVFLDGDFIRIENCRNVRRWGTTQGLGELRNGPLSGTELDVVGELIAPFHALQHMIPCNGF